MCLPGGSFGKSAIAVAANDRASVRVLRETGITIKAC